MNKELITAQWKNLAANKQNTAIHHIQYCILRAMLAKGEDKVAIAKHFIRKHFTPITSVNKLANGSEPFGVLSNWVNNAKLHADTNLLLDKPAKEFLSEEERVEFNRIYFQLAPSKLIRRYAYFFTRQDIFEEYQLVQTAHAALELGAKLTPEQVTDLHFTCCGVADLEELVNVERILNSLKLNYVAFREPDIGNQLTSIGVYPIEEHKRGILRSYNLLRFNRKVEPVKEKELQDG